MKKIIKQFEDKKSELKAREERREELERELSTSQMKLNESRKILLDTELAEISALRKCYSGRKVDNMTEQFEGAMNGQSANQCNPDFRPAAVLDRLRREVDEGLNNIYPSQQVQEMRAATESLRQAIRNIELMIANINTELENLEVQIISAKKEVLDLGYAAWNAIYQDMKADIRETVFPKIRRAFIAVNGYNAYALNWGDPRFWFDLLPEVTRADVLKEREDLRKEFFKS